MRKVTIDFLNEKKEQILYGATWLPKQERMEFFGKLVSWACERMEFFGELADWACEQYQKVCEMQEDEE